MVSERPCSAITDGGGACQAAPLRGSAFCFFHDPEHQAEAAEARRLGGLRRRRESAVGAAFDVEGLDSVAAIRRLLEIAANDTLSLENSIARARTLAYLAQAAVRLLEAGELGDRLDQLEAAMRQRRRA